MKAGHKNVTFSLPADLLNEFRVYAASRNVSMTQLAESAIRKIMANGADDEYERARRSFVHRLKNLPKSTFGGKITWTRDELHER